MRRDSLQLTTERLAIRPLARGDVPEFTRYRNVPEVARYQDWTLPYTTDLAQAIVDDAEQVGAPTGGRWLQLAVTAQRDGTLLGDVAVWLDEDELLATIGYTLAPEHWGNGYAAEAVGAVVDWLFSTRTVHRVTATIDPRNLQSARVLERNGFRYIGTARSAALVRGEWSDDARFEILADEWTAWKARPGKPEQVELAEITFSTVRAIGELDRAFSQRGFVSSVHQSYGDALFTPENDGERVRPWLRAIVADGDPVGFMMVAEPMSAQPHPYLWRFLIDWRHQGRGIGRAALALLARERLATGATHVVLGCVAGEPGSPEPFYRKLGFEPTGKVTEWGETEMIAPLSVLLDPQSTSGKCDESVKRERNSADRTP
jgi:RimJ/RimL family protein N-acetyltransferase